MIGGKNHWMDTDCQLAAQPNAGLVTSGRVASPPLARTGASTPGGTFCW
jgi:hypothetical protein